MAEIIRMPKLGFDMAEGTLVRWVRQVGEPIQKGDILAEIETDKATVEVEASVSGVVLQHLVDQGAVVPVNTPIAVIGQPGESVAEPAIPAAKPGPAEAPRPASPATATQEVGVESAEAAPSVAEQPIKASPLARRLALEHHLDLKAIVGSGPGGRIVRRDIEKVLAATQAVPAPAVAPAAPPVSTYTPLPSPAPADTVVATSKLRQAIGRRLLEAKQTIPHFYVTHEYRMDSLIELRQRINAYLPEAEKVSINDFIVKAVALTLRRFPNLNAALRDNEIIQFGHVNVGVAVTVPGGLLTVVVRNADQKPLRQISSEVKAMAARAREGKVKPEDVEGSTFSTSNLGMYDVDEFIAIINPPEAAILAIGSAKQAPVVENGALQIGWRMKATLSVDHRISDGAEAAQFLQALAEYLEHPLRLLI